MRIPLELLQLIANAVPDDERQKLFALAQGCHRFAAIVQPVIFRKVSLAARHWAHSGNSPAHKLIRLLNDSPHIAPLVKELCIIEGDAYMGRRLHAMKHPHGTTYGWITDGCRALSLVLPMLTKLERISMETVNSPSRTSKLAHYLPWGDLRDSFKSALENIAPQLRFLYLPDISIASVPELQTLIALMERTHNPALPQLTLLVKQTKVSPLQTLQVNWRPKPQSLKLSDQPTYPMLRFLSSCLDTCGLTHLSLKLCHSDELNGLLPKVFPQNDIKHLRIWFTDDSHIPHQLPDIAACFPRLIELYLCCQFDLALIGQMYENCMSIPSLRPSGVTIERPVGSLPWGYEDEQLALWEFFVNALRREGPTDKGIVFRLNKWDSSKSARQRGGRYGRKVRDWLRKLDAKEDLIRFEVISEEDTFLAEYQAQG
ncbi:hypothetical protein MIND_00171800 [Mycena indigotica]|uniref:F-box domain-containing protein n=1 Tax=Mycena indigotica TaxID=2126181 RepID=A0A8H6TIU9_9AGAR|nr:uncharacterized protein MIND_00171800 [Mycena indigotica]KAF7316525.1 hypothetical protein MIND_00171800 [Mycena indigotica]